MWTRRAKASKVRSKPSNNFNRKYGESFEESPFDPQFTGADLVDPTTEEKDDAPVDDLFRQDSPLDDASAPVFSTFENEVFSVPERSVATGL